MKRFALCLHDLRLSRGEGAEGDLARLRRALGPLPLTLHLICDQDIDPSRPPLPRLLRGAAGGELELVYHGASHRCPPGAGGALARYHKGEAEFLDGGFDEGGNRARYLALCAAAGARLGICPPCWLAGREARAFLRSLEPPFLEAFTHLRFGRERSPSLVVALGSRDPGELRLLRPLARALAAAARLPWPGRVRLVAHTADLESEASLDFFRARARGLLAAGYVPVLQRELR